MIPIAHTGHWTTTVATLAPVVAFLLWLGFATIRDRREGRGRG